MTEEGRKELLSYVEKMTAGTQVEAAVGVSSQRQLLEVNGEGVGPEDVGSTPALGSNSRALKANVLWLDVNPDAQKALFEEPEGKVRSSQHVLKICLLCMFCATWPPF